MDEQAQSVHLGQFSFQNQGENYEKFRPTYPKEIIDRILKTAQQKGTYVDIACGTGQLYFQIYSHFQKSFGLDHTEQQIQPAKEKALINGANPDYFILGDYKETKQKILQIPQIEKTGIKDIQFDLISVAQALHWFDIEPFFKYCAEELLSAQGKLVVISYVPQAFFAVRQGKQPSLNVDITPEYLQFYEKVLPYLSPQQDAMGNAYSQYPFLKYFNPVETFELLEDKECTLDACIGYLKTWSGYNIFMQQKGQEEEDPAETFKRDVLEQINISESENFSIIVRHYFGMKFASQSDIQN